MATGKLKIDIRRGRILDYLARDGQVRVAELSRLLGATPATIRTDLDTLAAEGRLRRIQGGAVALAVREAPETQAAAATELAAEKTAIAWLALDDLPDGSTLFLNSGTTTLQLARTLACRKRLNVVTNSLSAAAVLAQVPTVRVVLLGGEVNADYGFTYGGDAMQQLERYQPDWAVLSVDGVDAAQGLTTYHAEEAMIDRMMVRQARRVMITADHRKIGRAGFTKICDLGAGTVIVTDSGCDREALQALTQTGAQIRIARTEG